MPGLDTRAWGEQADSLLGEASKKQYCSVATQAEAKLREALHRCGELAASHLDETPKPDRLRTAVCCQLLRDLSQHAGPFAAVLKTICDELVRHCIWSVKCPAFTSLTPCARRSRRLRGSAVSMLEQEHNADCTRGRRFAQSTALSLRRTMAAESQTSCRTSAWRSASRRRTCTTHSSTRTSGALLTSKVMHWAACKRSYGCVQL